MKDVKRIVIPVDNSDFSKDVVKKGAFLAKLLDVTANVISVNDTHHFISSVILEEKFKKEAERALERFKKIGDETGVKIETNLISGKPAEEIVKFANEDDLIVIAHHDKKAIDRFIVGSISSEVVRNAPCSVLVVK